MKSHRLSYLLSALSFAFLFAVTLLPASAVNVRDNFQPGYFPVCYAEATANQTFATTTYADLAVATCAFTPTRNDPTTAGSTQVNPKADLIQVTYSLMGSKATATTGICAIFVNGAILANTARTTDFGEIQSSMSGVWIIPNTTVGAQTIKLQCKSGDTNIFTVAFGHLFVAEIVRY